MGKTKFEIKCEMAATILNGIMSNERIYPSALADQYIKQSAEIADKLYEEVIRLNKGDN